MFMKLLKTIFVLLLLTSMSYAQVNITAFSHNGSITWSNSVASNGFNTVEWASSLTSGDWSSNWKSLRYIPVTNENMKADVPMFYRVIWRTNSVADASQSIGTGDDATASFSAVLVNTTLMLGSTVVTDGGSQVLLDSKGNGVLSGDGTGTVNYYTGAITAIFNGTPSTGNIITASYKYMAGDATLQLASLGTATGIEANLNGTLVNIPILKKTIFVQAGDKFLRDNGLGILEGDGSGTVNYDTGIIWAGFDPAPALGINVFVRYYSE